MPFSNMERLIVLKGLPSSITVRKVLRRPSCGGNDAILQLLMLSSVRAVNCVIVSGTYNTIKVCQIEATAPRQAQLDVNFEPELDALSRPCCCRPKGCMVPSNESERVTPEGSNTEVKTSLPQQCRWT